MANFNFNKVIIAGRLTADPELKTTPSGIAVSTFTVAVNRRVQKDGESTADFFTVTAWRGTAEFICKYFRKSSSICIVGELQTRNWTDQQGNKRYATEIVANEVNFVDAKSEAPAAVQQAKDDHGIDVSQLTPAPPFEPIRDDEELPF